MAMRSSRERNRNIDLTNARLGTSGKTTDTKTKTISTIVVIVLMIVSAMGPAGIIMLFVFGVFAFIIGIMYLVFKSQVVDPNKPNDAKNIKSDIMRTIREKSEKEGDPMFKEARAYQKSGLSPKDLARMERCGHEESLKTLLEAGIIDRAEYADRLRKLNCSTFH